MTLADLYVLLALSLASARLTRAIVDDSITAKLREKAYNRWGDSHWLTTLIHCPWCTGWWVTCALTLTAHLSGLTSGAIVSILLIPASAYGAALFRKAVEG
jgi:hypothetical protein